LTLIFILLNIWANNEFSRIRLNMYQFVQPQSNNPNYTAGQTWGALKKAWRGYKIAKVQSDNPRMAEYAKKIRTLQHDLGIKQAEFPELHLSS
jgi:hypothetical protein